MGSTSINQCINFQQVISIGMTNAHRYAERSHLVIPSDSKMVMLVLLIYFFVQQKYTIDALFTLGM